MGELNALTHPQRHRSTGSAVPEVPHGHPALGADPLGQRTSARVIRQLSGHGQAWPVVQRAKAHLDRARQLGLEEAHVQESRVAEHEQVLRAVLDGRQQGAVSLLRTHLRAVLADVERVREELPHLFHDDTIAPTRRSIAVWT